MILTLKGGFHNVKARRFHLQPGGVATYKQFREMERHLCGVSGCTCGVWAHGVSAKVGGREMDFDYQEANRVRGGGLENVRFYPMVED
jgi:hypothetical protein